MSKPKNWDRNVEKARRLYQNRYLTQMEIAALALEVCEISWGGAKFRKLYTLKKFALDCGIESRTLSNWVGIKVSVYDKLPPEAQAKARFTSMAHTASKVLRDAPSETVYNTYKELTKHKPFDAKMRRYLGDIRSVAYNFEYAQAAKQCDKETLEEFLFYADKITSNILKECPELKPVSHGISSSVNFTRSQSAAEALNIPRTHLGEKIVGKIKGDGFEVRVTPKDRDIINYMRKHKNRYHSPTEIGVKLGGHNRNSASAWAFRTINKFTDTGLIERNKKGHYKWVG